MLNVTELRNGAYFKEAGNLFQVITYEHNKMGRGSGTIKLKVKNLKTGSITEKSFITGARGEEADVEKKKSQYLYRDVDSLYFMDPASFEQFSLQSSILGNSVKYLKDGLEIEEAVKISLTKYVKGAYALIIMFEDKLIAVRDPYGIRPLVKGKRGDDIFFASES